jgi:hypothetical protein
MIMDILKLLVNFFDYIEKNYDEEQNIIIENVME